MIRVLVVDDHVSFLTAAREAVFAADGFELAGVAQTGEEALELARLSRPDLALIDLHMPGIDGRETAERMATVSPETALVLMTATPGLATTSDGVLDKRILSPATLREIWDKAGSAGRH